MTHTKNTLRKSFAISLSVIAATALSYSAAAQIKPAERQLADDKKAVQPAGSSVLAPAKPLVLNRKPAQLAIRPGATVAALQKTTGWYDVGQPQFATTPFSRGVSSIAAPNGDIYTKFDTGGQGTQVVKFDGQTWTEIPQHISASKFSWAVDSSSTLYVAYQNNIYPPHYSAIHVKKLVGNTWQRVGTTYMKGATRSGAGVNLAIDQSTDKMYLTYGNGEHEVWPQHSKITVRAFNGADWIPVGPEELSKGGAGCFQVQANNGNVFLSYAEEEDDGRPKVYKLAGNSWQPYGNGFVSAQRLCPSMRLDSSDEPVLAYSGATRLEIKKLVDGNWTNFGQGWPPSKLGPIYKTHSMTGFQLDSHDNPIVTITGTKENTTVVFPSLWGHWSTVSLFKNGKWTRLGEQLPGYGTLTKHKGKPYLTLIYQKDYFDYDTIQDEDLENLPDTTQTFDRTLRVTVKKYVQGTDTIMRPAAASVK